MFYIKIPIFISKYLVNTNICLSYPFYLNNLINSSKMYHQKKYITIFIIIFAFVINIDSICMTWYILIILYFIKLFSAFMIIFIYKYDLSNPRSCRTRKRETRHEKRRQRYALASDVNAFPNRENYMIMLSQSHFNAVSSARVNKPMQLVAVRVRLWTNSHHGFRFPRGIVIGSKCAQAHSLRTSCGGRTKSSWHRLMFIWRGLPIVCGIFNEVTYLPIFRRIEMEWRVTNIS